MFIKNDGFRSGPSIPPRGHLYTIGTTLVHDQRDSEVTFESERLLAFQRFGVCGTAGSDSSTAGEQVRNLTDLCRARYLVSKPDEFCIKHEELCIKNEEFCMKTEEFCMKSEEFCIENDDLCSGSAVLQPSPSGGGDVQSTIVAAGAAG